MGYTHYFKVAKISQHSQRIPAAVRDMAKVIRKSPVPIAGPMGTGKPVILKGEIAFNGKSPNEYETFDFPGEDGFCKTQNRPYDIVVVACLAIAKDILGNEIEVSSDGGAEDWVAGVQLASDVLGRDIENPIAPRGGMSGVRMPKKRFILLDNGGKTTDRYTIFSTKPTGYVGHKSIQYAGFNEHPYHPQGFGLHGEISPSQFDAHRRERFRALGRPIPLDALPPDAQKFAKSFMDSVLEEDGQ